MVGAGRPAGAGPRATLAIGAADSGKSTLCHWLAAYWAQAVVSCWLVDADVGQSRAGPPGTVGYAHVGPWCAAAAPQPSRPADVRLGRLRMGLSGRHEPVSERGEVP